MCGAYRFDGGVCDTLLESPPPLVHPPAGGAPEGASLRGALALLVDELERDAPGQQNVLDRLLEFALRAWFAIPGACAPGWYAALGDPEVGRALQLLHGDPTCAWTVAGLGHEVGLSRAVLARRFGALVGTPPLQYLTSWRMRLAEELLRDSELGLAVIARQVGYSSEFAFSTAFKGTHGTAPVRWRDGMRANAA